MSSTWALVRLQILRPLHTSTESETLGAKSLVLPILDDSETPLPQVYMCYVCVCTHIYNLQLEWLGIKLRPKRVSGFKAADLDNRTHSPSSGSADVRYH